MKVHFLTKSERSDEKNLLLSYLNLVEIEVDVVKDITGTSLFADRTTGGIMTIMCCYLDSCTEKPKINGLSLYIDFLNESIRAQKSINDNENALERNVPINAIKCKNIGCNNAAMDDRLKFYGLCYDCFRKQVRLIQIKLN